MRKKSFTAVVLAGGSGKRMGGKTKKQYLLLNKKPLLYYSLKTFQESPVDEIVLVVPKGDVSYCEKEIVLKYGFDKVTSIIEGGEERYDSVYAALSETDTDYILIHDGARALITEEVIKRCMEDVVTYGSAVAGVPSKDTVKIVNEFGTVSETPDRSKVWIVQTPQCFETDAIWDAYDRMMDSLPYEERKVITDDAMVMETFSEMPVHMTLGDYTNIKITTPDDMILAEDILKK